MSLELDKVYQGKTINILVVINTDGVTGDPDPKRNFYKYVRMIDDQRNDPGQFGDNLTVTCHPKDELIFRVCGVKNDVSVQLEEFIHGGGDVLLVDLGYDDEIKAWHGVIDQTGRETYHWKVKINNREYEWDPYIQAN